MKITTPLFASLMLITGLAAQAETGYLPARTSAGHYNDGQRYSSGYENGRHYNDDEDVYDRTEDYGSAREMGRGRLPRQVRFMDLCSGNYYGVSNFGESVRMTIRPLEDGRVLLMMSSYSGTIRSYARCVQSAGGGQLKTEGNSANLITATISPDGRVIASVGKNGTFNLRRIYR